MAPIFVGSNNENTRIRSNRIGFAASTSDPGSAAEGDGYYNSSDNQLKFYDGSAWSAIQGSGAVGLVASGTLSNGATVVINTDGTVGVVTQTTDTTPSAGTPAVYESDVVSHITAAYDSTNDKVVIAYRDNNNSDSGTAIVGTINGTSISFGTPVVFNASTAQCSAVFVSGKVVITYADGANSNRGAAIVGTVSGTSISFGSETLFSADTIEYNSATYDSTNGKVVIAWRSGSNPNSGIAVVGTVSGTSISFGSEVVYESGLTSYVSATFDSTNGKVVIAYQDDDDSDKGKAIVGTVSGTSISFGTTVVFESEITSHISATYDSTNSKIVIAYRDESTDYGTAIVGTVSGTSISFGSTVTFESANSYYISAIYDSANGKVVIAYTDAGNSSYGTAIVGTVSGTSISFGTAVVFNSGAANFSSATYDSTNKKVVIAYKNGYGRAVVFTAMTQTTNLTTSNFLGFSDAAYSNGQTANIQIISSVDDAQTGLTTGSLHYVQNDGTLSTTAGNPSVEAGTALSATKIRIKS